MTVPALPTATTPPALYPVMFEPLLRQALIEDLGRAGDITSAATVPAHRQAEGRILAKHPGHVAGLEVALHAFSLLDPQVEQRTLVADGDDAAAGEVLATLRGNARALLAAERTALNLLGHLSGVATTTREAVAHLRGLHTQVTCTRKTTPGLRALEKYAVRLGGGSNHRFGLDDAILIKDNHLALAGGVRQAVAQARAAVGHLVKIEVEVETLAELDEALEAQAEVILFDNMLLELLRQAVGRAITEASGNVTLRTIRDVASTGVDYISSGWLTHSAPTLDVSLALTPMPMVQLR